MPVNILIFEDNKLLRESLKFFLDGVEHFSVCGDFENCLNAAEIVASLRPDVIFMDLDMPGVNGIEGLKLIKERYPETHIIMHTVFEDEERLFKCLCYGANGYILKNSSFNNLVDAIDNVMHGGAPLSPSIAKKLLHSFRLNHTGRLLYNLSQRETEVLQFLVQGYSYKMIAGALFISIDTVRGHIRNIYTKLHVNCGREAVAMALRDNIV